MQEGGEGGRDAAAVLAARQAKKLAKLQHKNKNNPSQPAAAAPAQLPRASTLAPPPAPPAPPGKTKAELRAERRAQQEQQRRAKLQEQKQKAEDVREKSPAQTKKTIVREARAQSGPGAECASWFRHLQPATPSSQLNTRDTPASVVRLCAAVRAGVVGGADARCVAFLHALQQVARGVVVGARVESARGLQGAVRGALEGVSRARPLTPAINNAAAHLRAVLAQLPPHVAERDAKCQLNEAIDTYIREQVETARHAISLAVRRKICHGDNILTFGCSSLVEQVLREAHADGARFGVLVVGSRTLVRRLAAAGLRTSYADMTALSYVMTHVDKVLLGCGALLANGSVLGRAGTAQTALAAAAHNVPVLVCCETHKFSERVQTDAFVYNELDERGGARRCGEARLMYDVTPPGLVTCVVTELAVLPCTSAPVVLRFKLNDAPF